VVKSNARYVSSAIGGRGSCQVAAAKNQVLDGAREGLKKKNLMACKKGPTARFACVFSANGLGEKPDCF